MNTSPKITYASALDSILALDLPVSAEVHDKLVALRGTFDKKADSKPTPKQVENLALQNALLDYMGENPSTLFTCSALIKNCPVCADLSTSKVSSLLHPLCDVGKVKRIEDKRSVLFQFVQR